MSDQGRVGSNWSGLRFLPSKAAPHSLHDASHISVWETQSVRNYVLGFGWVLRGRMHFKLSVFFGVDNARLAFEVEVICTPDDDLAFNSVGSALESF